MELTAKELAQEMKCQLRPLQKKLKRHGCFYREEHRGGGKPIYIYPFLGLSLKIQHQFIKRCALRYLYDLQKLPDLPDALKPLILGQIGCKHREIQQAADQKKGNDGNSKDNKERERSNNHRSSDFSGGASAGTHDRQARKGRSLGRSDGGIEEGFAKSPRGNLAQTPSERSFVQERVTLLESCRLDSAGTNSRKDSRTLRELESIDPVHQEGDPKEATEQEIFNDSGILRTGDGEGAGGGDPFEARDSANRATNSNLPLRGDHGNSNENQQIPTHRGYSGTSGFNGEGRAGHSHGESPDGAVRDDCAGGRVSRATETLDALVGPHRGLSQPAGLMGASGGFKGLDEAHVGGVSCEAGAGRIGGVGAGTDRDDCAVGGVFEAPHGESNCRNKPAFEGIVEDDDPHRNPTGRILKQGEQDARIRNERGTTGTTLREDWPVLRSSDQSRPQEAEAQIEQEAQGISRRFARNCSNHPDPRLGEGIGRGDAGGRNRAVGENHPNQKLGESHDEQRHERENPQALGASVSGLAETALNRARPSHCRAKRGRDQQTHRDQPPKESHRGADGVDLLDCNLGGDCRAGALSGAEAMKKDSIQPQQGDDHASPRANRTPAGASGDGLRGHEARATPAGEPHLCAPSRAASKAIRGGSFAQTHCHRGGVNEPTRPSHGGDRRRVGGVWLDGAIAPQPPATEPVGGWDNLPQKSREIALWREGQLTQYEGWLKAYSKQEIDHLLSQVKIPPGYGLKHLTRRALQLWRKAYQSQGLYGLAPKNGRRGRKVANIPKERIAHLSALYCDPRRPRLTDCLRRSFAHEAPHSKETIHEPKTYKAAIERAIEPVVLEFFRSKGQWNDAIFPYVRRDKSNLPALWLFNGDHKQCDFLVKYSVWEDKGKGLVSGLKRQVWKCTRPWLTAWQDVRSGAIVGWHLGLKSPSSEEVSLALRQAILEYGLPSKSDINLQLLMDNGADFRSLPIEMALARLNIERHFCHVQNAQGKPVERFFKTFDDRFARFESGYTGEKPENRPPTTAFYEKNPEHLMDLPTTQAKFAQWLEEFHHTPSRAEPQSPLELLNTFSLPTKPVGGRESAWLLPSRLLKVVRGQVEISRREGKTWIYRNKELTYCNGQMVQVFYDPFNADLIHVYEPLNAGGNSGRWITDCTVQPLAGWLESQDSAAIAHVKHQRNELEIDFLAVAAGNAQTLAKLNPAQIITEHQTLNAHYQTPAEKETTTQRRQAAQALRGGKSKQKEWDAKILQELNGQAPLADEDREARDSEALRELMLAVQRRRHAG